MFLKYLSIRFMDQPNDLAWFGLSHVLSLVWSLAMTPLFLSTGMPEYCVIPLGRCRATEMSVGQYLTYIRHGR